MRTAMGTSGLGGIAIGPLRLCRKSEPQAVIATTLGVEEELARFRQAKQQAKEELYALQTEAQERVGKDNAAIFGIHQMILEDEDFLNAVEGVIKTLEASAEYAVTAAGMRFAAVFAAMEDPYMRARSADMEDVSHRVVNILMGVDGRKLYGDEPAILVADDLSPSETVQLDKSKVLGFITRHGSSHSHTAILARTMNIPALMGVNFDESWDGCPAVLDGDHQRVYLEPDDQLLAEMEARQLADAARETLLQELRNKPNRTLDGREIQVYANIGGADDLRQVLRNDAQGIGLFRSEFLYLEGNDYPSEERQFSVYKAVAEAMAGKRVVIRTLDIGADKQADYFKMEKEENPALGCRAIRFCLNHPDVFKQQLRAILRASAYGSVAVMFPMIIDIWEVRAAKALLEACRAELETQGVPLGKLEVGIMVETPAAVMMAEELAQEVDFLSLGTNDLAQYTLAVDRKHIGAIPFYDPHHPALLRMIRHTVEAGHRHGCWVGICGELGADRALTKTFLRMGLDELSIAPADILPLRKHIRGLELSQL